MRIKIQNNINYWVTSDLHFGHKNVMKFSNRPFNNVNEMNQTLIDNWNRNVQDNDIVFNLGDFAFFNGDRIIETLEQLNGQQHFIYGNHDKNMKKPIVQEYCKNTNKIIGFYDLIECNYKGYHLFMSHYSHRVWNKSHYGALHLYGHSHGSLPGIGKSVDVGVDSQELPNNYSPLSLDVVIEYLNSKEIENVDHHFSPSNRECNIEPFSSRMCQRGTKSCIVDHGGEK
jgi:calcineurin-like phosphoesterase family protein